MKKTKHPPSCAQCIVQVMVQSNYKCMSLMKWCSQSAGCHNSITCVYLLLLLSSSISVLRWSIRLTLAWWTFEWMSWKLFFFFVRDICCSLFNVVICSRGCCSPYDFCIPLCVALKSLYWVISIPLMWAFYHCIRGVELLGDGLFYFVKHEH